MIVYNRQETVEPERFLLVLDKTRLRRRSSAGRRRGIYNETASTPLHGGVSCAELGRLRAYVRESHRNGGGSAENGGDAVRHRGRREGREPSLLKERLLNGAGPDGVP